MAKTQWILTEEGKVRLRVLRGFFFNTPINTSRPHGIDLIMPDVRRFDKGDHLLDPTNPADALVLDHTWIDQHFADGAVESPDVTRMRLQQEADAANVRRVQVEALQAEATAALARTTSASQSSTSSAEDIQDELNTPLNQPRRTRGAKSQQPSASKEEIDAELNTPLNQLSRTGK